MYVYAMSYELHPLCDLLLSRWAEDSNLEPDLVRSYVTDELPIPQSLAQEIDRVLGVPVSCWSRVSLPPSIKPLGSTNASPTRANASVPPVHVAQKSHGQREMPAKNRTGKPFGKKNSLTAWLDDQGKSARWLAGELRKTKYQTLAAWMGGANSWPQWAVDQIKALSGGAVGDDAFAKVRVG